MTIVAPYTLHVLGGELYGALRDLSVFNQVTLDPEIQTLVWPNGADFDPATLHDWPQYLPQLRRVVQQWNESLVKARTTHDIIFT